MARSVAFYKAMGFRTKSLDKAPDIINFDLDANLKLSLYPLDKLAEDIGIEAKSMVPNGQVTLAYNVHSKAEVDDTIKLAKQNGATILKAPQNVFWGGYSSYFQDPDGHIWEVAFANNIFDDNNMIV
jgi:predicted lactoylglutathione lyase